MVDRSAVIALHKPGKSNPEIVKTLNLHRQQVRQVVQRCQETGGIKDRRKSTAKSRRPRRARTSVLKKKVQQKI
ncbi:hypothetical protein L596_016099 [Steinernema carpocapsae]|uniref:Paired domain-containing protein n=1 Tax=Steinernema carpocapsae TaxID=34508 RepID=A0A4U5NHZ7_STECR|nr:hypothetical protein L596_016099 [Steinernema carpocapsae]